MNRLNQLTEASYNTVLSLTTQVLDKPIEEDVTFWCSNRIKPNYTQTFFNDNELMHKLNRTLPIAFITHGWFDNVNVTWMRTTVVGKRILNASDFYVGPTCMLVVIIVAFHRQSISKTLTQMYVASIGAGWHCRNTPFLQIVPVQLGYTLVNLSNI